MNSLNGGYAMIKYNSTQEELQIAYRSKKPVLCYDETRRAHWAVIEETATESVDEETQEPITIYEYSYRLIDEASGSEVHLYAHYINMDSGAGHLNLIIYSSSETPFTNETLYYFLRRNGMKSETNYYSATGFYDNGKIIMGIFGESDTFGFSLESYDSTNQVLTHTSSGASLSTFILTDTVKQIF